MKIDDIKDVKIEYRDKLDINPRTTIGMEIEFEKANLKDVRKKFNQYLEGEWKAVFDGSVSDSFLDVIKGGEINSPIITNKMYEWAELETVCEILKNEGAEITEYCGGHVHIGKNIIKLESYMNFIKLWYLYEPIIFRFCYGEYNRGRDLINFYAHALRINLWNIITSEEKYKYSSQIINYLGKDRNLCVNFQNIFSKKKTFEFRCPNSSLDPAIWQNNVNFFAHLLDKSNDIEIDKDKLAYEIKNYDLKQSDYIKIDMNEAIELADIIFDNEIDKLYFLRQYIKDGNDNNINDFTKTIKFTK